MKAAVVCLLYRFVGLSQKLVAEVLQFRRLLRGVSEVEHGILSFKFSEFTF
jgi:hypothetical protein